MAQLTIILDRLDPPLKVIPPDVGTDKIAVASLDLADDLKIVDVYATAIKLAEMLLEQMARKGAG